MEQTSEAAYDRKIGTKTICSVFLEPTPTTSHAIHFFKIDTIRSAALPSPKGETPRAIDL